MANHHSSPTPQLANGYQKLLGEELPSVPQQCLSPLLLGLSTRFHCLSHQVPRAVEADEWYFSHSSLSSLLAFVFLIALCAIALFLLCFIKSTQFVVFFTFLYGVFLSLIAFYTPHSTMVHCFYLQGDLKTWVQLTLCHHDSLMATRLCSVITYCALFINIFTTLFSNRSQFAFLYSKQETFLHPQHYLHCDILCMYKEVIISHSLLFVDFPAAFGIQFPGLGGKDFHWLH